MMQLVTDLLVVGLAAMVVFQCGCDDKGAADRGREQPAGDLAEKPAGNPVVVMETSEGTIRIELNADKAPISVKNFLQYVDEGFYDGTIFHRVVEGSTMQVIQGGGFTPDMRQKPTHAMIKNEAANGLANDRGSIAMARTNVVDSATSQFYINVKDNGFLNHNVQGYGYAVFGRVIDGLDVVDRIRTVRTATVAGMENVPVTPVVIKTARRAGK